MLRPVIDGEYWSGPDTITVEPQQSKNYELTYRPLTMTQEGKKHMVRIVEITDAFLFFYGNERLTFLFSEAFHKHHLPNVVFFRVRIFWLVTDSLA